MGGPTKGRASGEGQNENVVGEDALFLHSRRGEKDLVTDSIDLESIEDSKRAEEGRGRSELLSNANSTPGSSDPAKCIEITT